MFKTFLIYGYILSIIKTFSNVKVYSCATRSIKIMARIKIIKEMTELFFSGSLCNSGTRSEAAM